MHIISNKNDESINEEINEDCFKQFEDPELSLMKTYRHEPAHIRLPHLYSEGYITKGELTLLTQDKIMPGGEGFESFSLSRLGHEVTLV